MQFYVVIGWKLAVLCCDWLKLAVLRCDWLKLAVLRYDWLKLTVLRMLALHRRNGRSALRCSSSPAVPPMQTPTLPSAASCGTFRWAPSARSFLWRRREGARREGGRWAGTSGSSIEPRWGRLQRLLRDFEFLTRALQCSIFVLRSLLFIRHWNLIFLKCFHFILIKGSLKLLILVMHVILNSNF